MQVAVRGDRPGDERKKMNRSPRDFLVIFFFFLYLVEKGDVLCFTLIYLPLSKAQSEQGVPVRASALSNCLLSAKKF